MRESEKVWEGRSKKPEKKHFSGYCYGLNIKCPHPQAQIYSGVGAHQ